MCVLYYSPLWGNIDSPWGCHHSPRRSEKNVWWIQPDMLREYRMWRQCPSMCILTTLRKHRFSLRRPPQPGKVGENCIMDPARHGVWVQDVKTVSLNVHTHHSDKAYVLPEGTTAAKEGGEYCDGSSQTKQTTGVKQELHKVGDCLLLQHQDVGAHSRHGNTRQLERRDSSG